MLLRYVLKTILVIPVFQIIEHKSTSLGKNFTEVYGLQANSILLQKLVIQAQIPKAFTDKLGLKVKLL